MSTSLVIFGTGSFAEVAAYLFDHDSEYDVVGHTVDRDHMDQTEFYGKPVVPFEDVEEEFPPDEFDLFVGIGYRDLNRLREEKCRAVKQKGYELASYISSEATTWPNVEVGENCFIFEENNLQPFVEIGDNVVLWSGNHIGHHTKIEDHCFLTSHVVVSGHVEVGSRTFIGVNATLRDDIRIGEDNIIGAGALVMEGTEDSDVLIPEKTESIGVNSEEISLVGDG